MCEVCCSDSLLDEVAKAVTHIVVSSRVDYCNALYAGMSEINLLKLQRVHNVLLCTRGNAIISHRL